MQLYIYKKMIKNSLVVDIVSNKNGDDISLNSRKKEIKRNTYE